MRSAAVCGLELTTGQDHSHRAMLLEVGDLLAALNEVSNARARGRAPGTGATTNISRNKYPIVTIGYVPTSLATSTAVLSNQRNTG